MQNWTSRGLLHHFSEGHALTFWPDKSTQCVLSHSSQYSDLTPAPAEAYILPASPDDLRTPVAETGTWHWPKTHPAVCLPVHELCTSLVLPKDYVLIRLLSAAKCAFPTGIGAG